MHWRLFRGKRAGVSSGLRFQYASNDTTTIVVPDALESNQPIWGFW